jgi:hypothetical protein
MTINHPLPPLPHVKEDGRKGWEGLPFVPLDGQNWSLEFAAKILGCSKEFLADRVRHLNIPPAGVIRMSEFSRKGRQPRAYPAVTLIAICEEEDKIRVKIRKKAA